MGSLVKKLLRRVISWAYPGSLSKPAEGGEIKLSPGRIEVDPQTRDAFEHILDSMNKESRRRGRP